MSTLSEQEQRWLSGKHIGSSTPVLRAFVRTGHLERRYRNLPDKEVFAYIPGLKGPNAVWKAHWVPTTDYVEVPNIANVKGENDFEQKGVEQITMQCDNVELAQHTGLAGIFHTFERGFMAPTRGDAGYQEQAAGESNEWRGTWSDQSTQIMVVAGYGDAHFPVFLGLVDDCDLSSAPDQITITARNMGKFLTDQHCFMDAKHLFVKDPITFCDRQRGDNVENVAKNATAKSNDGSHFARFAVDDDEETFWISEGHGSENELEWIDITVPNSRIEDFQLLPRFDGLEMFVSVFATNTNVQNGGPARTTDEHDVGEGWVSYEKIDNVPGTDIPYVNHVGTVNERSTKYKVRKGGGGYVSDIVKTVLQWVGLTEWEIETVGSRLKDKIVFDRNSFLVDIIDKIAEATSYVFYVKPPDSFDVNDLSKGNEANLSMGVAVFRQNNAMTTRPREKRYTVRDDKTITGIQPQFTSVPLAQSVRVRGKLISSWKALQDPDYIPKRNDNIGRFFYNYRPVWARDGSAQAGHGAAGLRKHEFHTDQGIVSNYECKVACLLIAFRMALQASACSVQVPFFPPVNLDQQIAIYDEGTGVSSRIWIASRDWEYVGGEERKFYMTLGGSLLDIEIVERTRKELAGVLNDHGYNPAPIARGPWEDVHLF